MLLPIAQCLGVIAVCGAVVVAAPLAQRFTTPQSMPRCEPGKWPEFNYGFAALRLDLGADMGDALECEHATSAVGDTDQLTSTGLAHYDRASNTPSFRHNSDNWALTARGLVFWPGMDTLVPSGAVAIPSPGSARLAAAAQQNSTVARPGVLGGARPVATATPVTPVKAPASVVSAWLSTSQIAGVAALLGIKDDQVQSMTADDLSQYTQQSGGSVAEVTRTINTDAP
jgi:hypothetical protein